MMSKLNRRAFLRVAAAPAGLPSINGISDGKVREGASRREFLEGTAGAAAGAAVILATPKVASVALDAAGVGSGAPAEPKGVVTKPSGPAPYEPVTAYVRDADRHEVTVMSGQQETTYKDPALVKRLLDAAR
jgi:hypothetical protein